VRPRLREIVTLLSVLARVARACARVAHAGVAVAAMTASTVACSAPASEAALARSHAEHSLGSSPAGSSSGGDSDGPGARKARSLETSKEARTDELRGRCPRSMVEIEGKFCIDRYEASLVDVLPNGEERAHSPFGPVEDLQRVRAVSTPNVFPQGYISAVEASQACASSGKRLCRVSEWGKACRGPETKSYGYADRREPGRCNDTGKNPVLSLYGRGHWNWPTMNHPELNQQENTLARTGEHAGCTNGYGVYDMVGNLHEWVADPAGTFYGGYYQDVASVGHGEGCGYLTTAHEARYHDYSTGFRCCSDVAGAPAPAGPESKMPAPAPKRPRKKR
jgi:formylglycine-generating enzyme